MFYPCIKESGTVVVCVEIVISSHCVEAYLVILEVALYRVGNLEHVVAGAATCLQAITESEKWKLAPEDLVSEVCNLNTTALGDKSTRTVAQMQLARSLSIMNPESCHVYGARLLNVAQEVLSDSTYSWQLRKSAAEMAQSILEIVDRKALDLVLNSITQVGVPYNRIKWSSSVLSSVVA